MCNAALLTPLRTALLNSRKSSCPLLSRSYMLNSTPGSAPCPAPPYDIEISLRRSGSSSTRRSFDSPSPAFSSFSSSISFSCSFFSCGCEGCTLLPSAAAPVAAVAVALVAASFSCSCEGCALLPSAEAAAVALAVASCSCSSTPPCHCSSCSSLSLTSICLQKTHRLFSQFVLMFVPSLS